MNNVLIVDDDTSFLLSLSDGLRGYINDFSVTTAENGKLAIEYLAANPVDLVVTDLNMPVVTGFELLTHISKNYPGLPVIVMTAFGTPNIEEHIDELGVLQYIEKPLNFKLLANMIKEGLTSSSSGYINNMNLVSFMQLIEIEKKTCTLTVKENNKLGRLYFKRGSLLDAEVADINGMEAAFEIVCWTNASIEISSICRKKEKHRKIDNSLHNIFMEGFVRKDEQTKNGEGVEGQYLTELLIDVEDEGKLSKVHEDKKSKGKKEISRMDIHEKLKALAAVDGFIGAGLFTPTGEAISLFCLDSKVNLEAIGILANNILMNAMKASIEMGMGRTHIVHVEAERTHILVNSLNEGSDPMRCEPGRAHIHLIMILTLDGSLGLAKLRMASAIQSFAEECRM